jgi:undecaprenyl-diphosphatase
MTFIVKFITYLADPKVVAGICLVLLVLPTRMKFGIPLTVACFVSTAAHYGLKFLIHRPRPDEANWLISEDGYSFPSGHSNGGMVFYLFLAILLYKYFAIDGRKVSAYLAAILIPIIPIIVGLSRLYLGVHYPSDVLGGWLLGIVLVIAIQFLYNRFYPTKYRFTNEEPGWEMIRKQKPWKKPVNRDSEMVEFPKNRSAWKPPAIKEKKHTETLEDDVE